MTPEDRGVFGAIGSDRVCATADPSRRHRSVLVSWVSRQRAGPGASHREDLVPECHAADTAPDKTQNGARRKSTWTVALGVGTAEALHGLDRASMWEDHMVSWTWASNCISMPISSS